MMTFGSSRKSGTAKDLNHFVTRLLKASLHIFKTVEGTQVWQSPSELIVGHTTES
jgi:hypothetical protein